MSPRVCHPFMFHSVFLAVFAASLDLLVTVSNKRVQIVTFSNERWPAPFFETVLKWDTYPF